jgi:3-phenylpropionate/cinnamic acid dioxygenase small subunit
VEAAHHGTPRRRRDGERAAALSALTVARADVEALLYREARLLDENRLDEWLALFTDDAVYWVPAGGDAPDPTRHVSLVYDDRQRLGLRVDRLQGSHAYGQDPPSRICRIVTNVEVDDITTGAGEIDVHSVLTLVEVRAGKQHLYAARCRHRLRDQAGLKIARKEVRLVNRDDVFDNLTLLL